MVMSYPVIITHESSWFFHAENHAWRTHTKKIPDNLFSELPPSKLQIMCWSLEYNSILEYRKSELDQMKVIFPDEKEYLMFLLRWS